MGYCDICGDVLLGEYKCVHGHQFHKSCLKSSTPLKRCLLCNFPVSLSPAPKKPAIKKPRANQCKAKSKVMGRNGQPKRCRNKTHGEYCHLHTPSVEAAADTIQL